MVTPFFSTTLTAKACVLSSSCIWNKVSPTILTLHLLLLPFLESTKKGHHSDVLLILVLRSLIFPSRLHAVVTMAKRLPITPIPEKLLIASVWNDVVDVRCLHVPAFLHAFHAQGVRLKKVLPGFPPSSSITSAGSRTYFLRMHVLMLLTIFASGGHELRTTGVPARDLWFCRHQ